MASGVNIKMGVSGVSDVKKDINAVKESLKTLDKQLKLTETQFESTGDKEAYLQEKSALLEGKLQGLQHIADSAKQALDRMAADGVDKSSRAFQDMQRQLLDAKTQMIDTQGQIDALGTSESDAGEKADDLNGKLEGIGNNVSVQNVVGAIDKITGGIEKATKKAIRLGQTLVNNVLGAGQWADDLQTTAAQWEMTPEELQRIQKTAQIIDTDAETILKARQKLMKTAAGKGGKKTLEETLGISLEGQNPEDLFWEVGEALMNMDDSFDKEAAATQLFGKSWRELLPLFTAGRKEYEELNDSWTVVSQEQLDSLQSMDDEYQKLTANIETLKQTALAEFAEPMAKVMETLNGLMSEFGKWLDSDEGRATVDNVISTITGALQWIVDNKETAIAALTGIVAAWGGLKLTGGLMQLYQLITGLKGLGILSGGAGAAAGAGGGAAAGGGGIASIASSFFGSGALGTLGVAAAGILPALLAQAGDEARWKQQYNQRREAAGKLGGQNGMFMLNAAEALNQIHQFSDDPYKLLMGMASRGSIEKAQLFSMLSGSVNGANGNYARDELLKLWAGEGDWDQARLDGLLTSITDAYERMAKIAEESGKTGETAGSGGADAQAVTDAVNGIPGAVSSGLSGAKVVMDGTVVGRLVAGEVSRQIAYLIN